MTQSTTERDEKPGDKPQAFAREISRQCRLITAAEKTPQGRADAAFWEAATADAWE